MLSVLLKATTNVLFVKHQGVDDVQPGCCICRTAQFLHYVQLATNILLDLQDISCHSMHD